MSKRLKILTDFATHLFGTLVSHLVPKNPKLVVFGSWEGKSFADNSKYLFWELCKKNDSTIRCVWITRNPKVFEHLSKLGLPVLNRHSWRGIWTCLRAKTTVTTHSLADVGDGWSAGSFHLDTYHATLPIKKMGYEDRYTTPQTFYGKLKRYLILPVYYNRIDAAFSSSSFTQKFICSSLKIPPSKTIEVEYPRMKYLHSQPREVVTSEEAHLRNTVGEAHLGSRLVYFVPTFWNDKDFDFFAYGFDLEKLVAVLEKHDAVFVCRLHPFDQARLGKKHSFTHPRFRMEQSSIFDPYTLLSKSDVLLTDYSSIFADFLVLDRPCVFLKFDEPRYLKERDLYWNYDEIVPGPVCKNWDEAVRAIESGLERKDGYQPKRQTLLATLRSEKAIEASEAIQRKLK
jgi:CDP-glycerol glycerophosphotransferase (TagB/SpsB family)